MKECRKQTELRRFESKCSRSVLLKTEGPPGLPTAHSARPVQPPLQMQPPPPRRAAEMAAPGQPVRQRSAGRLCWALQADAWPFRQAGRPKPANVTTGCLKTQRWSWPPATQGSAASLRGRT